VRIGVASYNFATTITASEKNNIKSVCCFHKLIN
jgi:hypothetical protein